MLVTFPNEVLWLILVHFLNEEYERKPENGEYDLDHSGNRKPNQLYDANARQGIVMVWKLVCNAFYAVCPLSIQSPLIGLCNSYEELKIVRDLWNPKHDSEYDAMFLSHALQNANPTLAARMPLSLPSWINHQDFSKLIASYEFCEVLQYFEEQVGVDIDYDDLIAHVIRKDKYDVAKWLINRRIEMTAPFENALNLDKCLLRAIKCGSANAVKAVDEIRGPFETNELGEIVDPLYKTAIARAAHYGKLNVVKLLHEQLGYEMNKEVVITALQRGHMHVAEYADKVPSSRCTVGDLMGIPDNPNWTPEKVSERDPEYLEHYSMSAVEHVTTYTLERAQDKWHRAQQLAGKLTGAAASAGTTAERRMQIWKEKQRFREQELAKRAAKAQKTER